MIFAHGSGSSRLSPRDREVAATLNDAGLATLLFDLLTEEEGRRREPVFDIPLLASRLEGVTRWVILEPDTQGLPLGYFGASDRCCCRVAHCSRRRRCGTGRGLARRPP